MGIYIDYMEIECFEFLVDRVRRAYLVDRAVDLEAVVVNNYYQVVQLMETCEHGCFPYLSFFDFTVAQKGIYAVISVIQFSAESHACCCGNSLA